MTEKEKMDHFTKIKEETKSDNILNKISGAE
jgi:hypothetical protein